MTKNKRWHQIKGPISGSAIFGIFQQTVSNETIISLSLNYGVVIILPVEIFTNSQNWQNVALLPFMCSRKFTLSFFIRIMVY